MNAARFIVWAAVALAVAVAMALLLGRAPKDVEPDLTVPAFLPASQETVRFVAIGDQGKGNERQRQVGEAIGIVCAERGGCDFAVTAGDNFYPSGVASVDDPQWQSAFEVPYGALGFPFFPALGNHDYGADGGGWEFWRARAQLDYAKKNPQWKIPARHYAFGAGPVDLFVLDTTELFWGRGEAQAHALQARYEASKAPWKIVTGHHPLKSNGKHGDAGVYDRVPAGLPASGVPVKRFLEAHVCGQADLYIAGHDHNLQDLVSPCPPTEMIISGAGANTTRLVGSNPVHFESSSSGFVLVTATASELRLEFFDQDATRLHERVVSR